MATEVEFIDEVLKDWTPIVLQTLHDGIKVRNLILTENLYKSLRYELIKASAGMVAQAKFYFNTSGRWKDMRTYRKGKQLPVDAILNEFVSKLGVYHFKYVPGYQAGKTIPTDSIAMRRIAWGISKGILKKRQTAAKKWYSKNFYGTVNTLITNLMAGTQDETAAAVKNNL